MNYPIQCYEFIGIWGSGKTTLISDVSKKLVGNGLVVKKFPDFDKESKLKRYYIIFFFILKNPLHATKLLYLLIKMFYKLKPLDKLQIQIFKTLFKRILIKDIMIDKNTDIFFSEGILHLLTMFNKMNKLSVKEILFCVNGKFLSKLNYAVHIRIDKDIALRNIIKDNKNGYFRFNKIDFDNLENLFNRMLTNESLIRKIIHSSKINIFDIYGSAPFSKKANYLFNFVKDNIKSTKY